MMPIVVNRHRLRVDVRLERVNGVAEGRERERAGRRRRGGLRCGGDGGGRAGGSDGRQDGGRSGDEKLASTDHDEPLANTVADRGGAGATLAVIRPCDNVPHQGLVTRTINCPRFKALPASQPLFETGAMHRLTAVLVLLAGVDLSAHELFFRLDAYFVAPGATVTIPVYSGRFVKNENAITRDRLGDLSVTTAAGRRQIDRANWSEKEPMSTLTLKVGDAGTYLVGASIKPKILALDGRAFNDYLKDEGLDTILAARTKTGRLADGSRERYSKYPTFGVGVPVVR